jgi:hypothetical protein
MAARTVAANCATPRPVVAGALEEDIRLRQIPVQEAQIQLIGGQLRRPAARAHAHFQAESGLIVRPFLRQEHGHVPDREGLQQALADRIEHGIQIGFRVQLAGELHQRAPVIVAVAIEVLVQPLLNPVADGLEQEGGHQHHRDQAGVAHILEVLLHQAAEREDDAVEGRQHAHVASV